ncbi:MAG: hypothetical protein AAFU41_12380 [Pseudomonadota bacterium]
MTRDFYLGHKTDSVLGREGVTLDWPLSIPGFTPELFNNFVVRPPAGSDWRNLLPPERLMQTKPSVRPFALYYEWSCNLVLLAEGVFSRFISHRTTFTTTERGQVVFGDKALPYVFCSLVFPSVFEEGAVLTNSEFFLAETSGYHIHGTRVLRGEHPLETSPKVHESGITFDCHQEYKDKQKQNLGMSLLPSKVRWHGSNLPQLFATSLHLYADERTIAALSMQTEPGMGFPYQAIRVETPEQMPRALG